jgi:hypothetical protein
MAGMTRATAASSSISDWTLAAVRSKRWRSAAAPGQHGRAHDEQDVAEDGADDRRLDDLLEALAQGEQGDDELGEVAEGDVEEAADTGPGAGRQLLGGPAHRGRGRDHPEGGGHEDRRGPGVEQLQHDGHGMNGTSRYGQPSPLSRNLLRLKRGSRSAGAVIGGCS